MVYSDNQGNYNTLRIKKTGDIDAFEITDRGMSGYDICYTALSNKGKWTSIGCNGNLVTTSKGEFITNLIIYIKESGESVPSIVN